jgi:hypothetical protein
VSRNPEARLLLFVFFIEALGLGGLTVLVPFVTQYVMHRPDLTEAMLSVYVLAGGRRPPGCGSRRFEARLWLSRWDGRVASACCSGSARTAGR